MRAKQYNQTDPHRPIKQAQKFVRPGPFPGYTQTRGQMLSCWATKNVILLVPLLLPNSAVCKCLTKETFRKTHIISTYLQTVNML